MDQAHICIGKNLRQKMHEISKKTGRNKTITLTKGEIESHKTRLLNITGNKTLDQIKNRTIHGDIFEISQWLPENSIDLLVADPPYNLTKKFHDKSFRKQSQSAYENWLKSWLPQLVPYQIAST